MGAGDAAAAAAAPVGDADSAVTECVKSILFGYANSSKTLPGLIAALDFDGAARDMVLSCYDRVVRAEGGRSASTAPGLALGVLATGIIHFILTKSLIRSQRAICHGGSELDVVIPDAKTLDADPGNALVICVAKTMDRSALHRRLAGIARVQPVQENVWLVVPESIHSGGGTGIRGASESIPVGAPREFVISEDGGSFAGAMFSEIIRFAGRSSGSHGKLRILGI